MFYATLLALAPATAAAAVPGEPLIPAEALRADLRLAIETIEHNHPELGHSVDPARLAAAVADVERRIDRPMTQAEAWSTLARLNPALADGHLLIGLPAWRARSAEAVKRGAGFFPFEVSVDADGVPRILAALGGAPTPLAGRRLLRIDGRDAPEVTRELLARAHGDTPAFRAALLSNRWWLFHRNVYGAPAGYDLVVEGGRRRRVEASHILPAVLERDASFELLYRCEVRPGGDAILTASAFDWEDHARYFAFTRDCFSRMKAAGTKRLVVDVRANGGGDDSLWKDGILRYIADRPYKIGSTATKRVLERFRSGDEVVGEVVTAPLTSEVQPALDEPLRFKGKLYVLVGPSTYSSAVLFSNVVQDYRFGTVAGTGGAVRSRQSGSTQVTTLPNSGLVLSWPRFVLIRPSGSVDPLMVQPDVALADNPFNPRAAIDALLSATPAASPSGSAAR